MGFDFQMVRSPDPVPDGYSPLFPSDPGYFRFTGSGMSAMLEVMFRAGVLDDDTPGPDLSSAWPPQGLDPDRVEAIHTHLANGASIDTPPSEIELTLYRHAVAALSILRTTPPRASDTVAAFKFCSNDEWLVTPAECLAIASRLAHALATQPGEIYPFEPGQGPKPQQFVSWINGWVAYNSVAARHGGYVVS